MLTIIICTLLKLSNIPPLLTRLNVSALIIDNIFEGLKV